MRISMIGPVTPYRGGIAHFTTMLAKKLREAGHDLQMISFKKQYPNWLYPGKSDKDFSPGREKVEAEFLLNPINPLTWWKTVRAIVSFQPEKVIIPWWVTFWAPAFHHIMSRLKKHQIPITVLIHNTMPHEARTLDRYLVRRTLKDANNFIVMTEKEKKRLLELMPEARNIQITPLPVYHSFKSPGINQSQAKAHLGLPANHPVILFFGFVRPYKGLTILIDAFNLNIKNGLNAHLLIVGEFWEDKEPYLRQIQKYGLQDRIQIIDKYIPDDEVAFYFKCSDVFVAPYVGGTQSAALKTALGFGLPVVATDIISDKLLEAMPDRCKIVPAGNSEEMAAGIEEQLSKRLLTSEEIENFVEFSWIEMLSEVSEIPEKIKTQSQPKNDKDVRSI